MRNTIIALASLLLFGCSDSSHKVVAKCENDAQKSTVGMVSKDPELNSLIEDQRIELVRSCMVSSGFKYKVDKFNLDLAALPYEQWAGFRKNSMTSSNYWER